MFPAKTGPNEPHLKCIEPRTVLQRRDYANPCTASPVSSIFIFPTPTFMYFSGSTSELPWKCESILLSAWEVGWEVAHLHLKQQAPLSGAQNRPVEMGWKSTPALHSGSSWITALHGIVLKGLKWIKRTSPMRGSQTCIIIIPFPLFTPSKPSYITGSIKGFTFFPSLHYSWAANVLTYMCQQGGNSWIKHIVKAHQMRIPCHVRAPARFMAKFNIYVLH